MPDNEVPHLPVSPQRIAEDLSRATRRPFPRQPRWLIWSLAAVVVLALVVSLTAGAHERADVREAARTQYRSLTGEGGYDVSIQESWGNCAAAQMTDGRTAILVKTNGSWVVVRHSTYTDDYDLDSIDEGSECRDIATGPQAPSYP